MEKLYELRKQRNITQFELAQALNLSQQVLSRYERGEREADYKLLKKIAKYFDVSIDYLLGSSEYYYPDAISSYIPSASTLSEKESSLISLYRKLKPHTQAYVYGIVENLAVQG